VPATAPQCACHGASIASLLCAGAAGVGAGATIIAVGAQPPPAQGAVAAPLAPAPCSLAPWPLPPAPAFCYAHFTFVSIPIVFATSVTCLGNGRRHRAGCWVGGVPTLDRAALVKALGERREESAVDFTFVGERREERM
jgi:hypothetical protein